VTSIGCEAERHGHVTDDEMVIDWSGTDRDVRGPINLPVGQTEAFCSLVFKALTTPDTPVVAGNFVRCGS